MNEQTDSLTIGQFKDQKKQCEKELNEFINQTIRSFNFPFKIYDVHIECIGSNFETDIEFTIE